MGHEHNRINIFPFTTSFFKNASDFEYYLREVLPDILTVEHTQLRKPNFMVFAYQGDHSLWGYAEIEDWKDAGDACMHLWETARAHQSLSAVHTTPASQPKRISSDF